jgi:hypothetical protein
MTKIVWAHTDVALCGISVADPGCLSQILIFFHSGSQIQKRQNRGGGEKFVILTFLLPYFYKCKIIYFLTRSEKKITPIDKNYLQKKIYFQKYGLDIRDPEKKLTPNPDTGVRCPDPQHWVE